MTQLVLEPICLPADRTTFTFYEFFAGAGMARAGLGLDWQCLFANDFDHKKGRSYETNWGPGTLKTADVATIGVSDLPDCASLVWGSFPCQDLSLAGGGAGLTGDRSGTFWPFWRLMQSLISDGRAPEIVALENVCGALTSHNGKDFAAICCAMHDSGYRCGAVVVDASHFLPQSRPRLFVIGVRRDVELSPFVTTDRPCALWHTATLRRAYNKLPDCVKDQWLWWSLPAPVARTRALQDIIEDEPTSVRWHTCNETSQLLAMMSEKNLAKVTAAQLSGRRMVGGVYKRTRQDEVGRKVQRAEVRFDDLAGCLRTPAGGSSRQVILVVEGDAIKSRLISSRETARLMGLPDDYELPDKYNEAYHLTGDGVVVPVVRHLAAHIFEPLLALNARLVKETA